MLKNTILKLLRKGYSQSLSSLMDKIHPSDLAMAFSEMSPSDTGLLFDQISNDKHCAQIIVELKNKKSRNSIITGLSSKRIKQVFSNIKPNIAAKILDSMPKKDAELIVRLMDKSNADEVDKILKYKSGTAGSIMNTVFIHSNSDVDPEDLLKKIKKSNEQEDIEYIYVKGKDDELIGRISLKMMLLRAPNAKNLESLCDTNIVSLKHSAKISDVIRLFKKYRPSEVAVLGPKKQLLGIIGYNDFIRIITDETQLQRLRDSGSANILDILNDTPWTLFKARIGLLSLCMISGVFIYTLLNIIIEPSSYLIKALFVMPTIMLLSLFTSSQSFTSSSVLLTEYDYQKSMRSGIFIRELKTSSAIGALFAIIFYAYNYLLYKETLVAIMPSSVIFISVICSSFIGTIIPIALSKVELTARISLPTVSLSAILINSLVYLWLSTVLAAKGII